MPVEEPCRVNNHQIVFLGLITIPFSLGFDVQILKENGEQAERNQLGRVVCKLPLPPGTLSTLYKAEDRFREAYFKTFPGYYDTCDAGIIDEQGYIHILARDDDVINVAGHRLSTSALEEVVLKVMNKKNIHLFFLSSNNYYNSINQLLKWLWWESVMI